jgi:hypothetical protein
MKVGLLVGRESSFPEEFIKYVNSSKLGIEAEMLKVGGFKADELCKYSVIIDRISHEIPFYRSFLKTAALSGTTIINNPFWWSADDKFFGTALLERLGIAIPKTILLPQRDYIPAISGESLRNLEFPLDWNSIIEYTGLPAIMKPFDGGGWKNVYKVNSLEELLFYYDRTGTICMMLQEFINFDRYVRCYTIGRKNVLIMPYDPTKPYLQGQYFLDKGYLEPKLEKRIIEDCIKLNEALGYDMNTAEFAIRDGIPYAIDFTNPAPDADAHSVGEENQRWLIEHMAELCAEYAKGKKKGTQELRWNEFLNPKLVAAK